MAFYIQMNFVVVSFLIGLFFGDGKFADPASPTLDFLFRAWVLPSLQDMLMMFAIGLFSGLGAYFISHTVSVKQEPWPPLNIPRCLWPFFGVSSSLVNGPIWFHGLESFSLLVPDY